MAIKKDGEWCVCTVPQEWNEWTIEDILKEKIGIPKKILHELRMEKGVKINGEVIPWRDKVKTDDQLSLHVLKRETSDVFPQNQDLKICYEDELILVANKPYNMDTHPNEKGEKGTLLNGVVGYTLEKDEQCPIRHIHRLDKDTTGGVIFAKYPLPGAILDKMLAEKIIGRQYVALVHGLIKKDSGSIRESIGRDRHHPTRRRVSPKGDSAVTHFKVLKRFPRDNYTLVALTLETGRTHQIRVHMSYLGHPLVGDTLYGGKTNLLQRQALHGGTVKFIHPITKKNIQVEIPLPIDLQTIIEKLS